MAESVTISFANPIGLKCNFTNFFVRISFFHLEVI